VNFFSSFDKIFQKGTDIVFFSSPQQFKPQCIISKKGEKNMLRKLSYLALAAMLSLSPIIGSAQSMMDSTKLNQSSKIGMKSDLTKGTTVMHHKTRKHHKKTVKKALFKTQTRKTSKPRGIY
jgi:hypothetical protein